MAREASAASDVAYRRYVSAVLAHRRRSEEILGRPDRARGDPAPEGQMLA